VGYWPPRGHGISIATLGYDAPA